MAQVNKISVFATGTSLESAPDSISLGSNSVWVEYGNGADSTGLSGSSTIVQYGPSGQTEFSTSIAGSVDGLKVDPVTGMVWALQNQDGNSTLSLIDPKTGTVSSPLSYAVLSATRGYDDVAFLNGQVYLSYTNPVNAGDPVLQQLVNGNQPQGALVTTTLLALGATGTNVATGQANQVIPLNDPDSLKTTPNGSLVLTSGSDNAFAIISAPGTAAQSVRFDQLTNLPAGSALDDVIVPGSNSGTFLVANAGTNQIEAIKVSGLNTSDAYASVGTEIVQVDLQTGAQTVLVAGLNKSHGLTFVPTYVPGPVVQSTSIFALGSEVNATAPDSITTGGGATFVEYGNVADSTGKTGSSTLVQYGAIGQIERTLTLPGVVDGLKIDPNTGKLWALDNQDGNSRLYLIDPATGTVGKPLFYAPPYVYGGSSSRGFDDVAFSGNKVFLSETNPVNTGDPILVQLDNGNNPTGALRVTPILRFGDTGTNLTTGQVNQPLPITDPDSLKTLADGSLVFTGSADGSLLFVAHPGTAAQSVSFVQLPGGVSGVDDAIVPTATSGTFVISNTGANDVLKVAVTGLNLNDVYVSVGSANAIEQLDPHTGMLTPVIVGLNNPHGMTFIAAPAASPAPSPMAALFHDDAGTLQQNLSAWLGGHDVSAPQLGNAVQNAPASPQYLYQTSAGHASAIHPTIQHTHI